MLNYANAFIFLPRDFVTLETLITFVSCANLNIHKRPIGLLNVNNFYDGLLIFINHAIKNHFVSQCKKLFICISTANKLLDLLHTYTPEPDLKTYELDWSTDDGSSSSSKKCKLDLTLCL